MKTKALSSKILSMVLAFLFLFALVSVSSAHVYAAGNETITYLALGDSISTGYGLSGYTPQAQSSAGFTYQIASALGYTLINKAVDGNTSVDILDQLTNASNPTYVSEDELAAADVITITVGGNDLMALLYAKIAEQTASTTDTAGDIPDLLQSGNMEALLAAINLLTASQSIYIINDPDFQPAINAIIGNLNAIVDKIKSVNSRAQIVVATQYNPYVEFKNAVLLFLRLDAVYNGMEAGVTALNAEITANAVDESSGTVRYLVAGVKAAFDAYTGSEDLYNAKAPAGGMDMDVDFHPTAAGHELIASTFGAILAALDQEPKTVTIDVPYDEMMIASVTGAGTYSVGESVTLTAIPITGEDQMVFYYWLDNSVPLTEDPYEFPTEEELKAAIVSYDSSFTFTATENVSYTPVVDYEQNKLDLYLEGCLFEDDSFEPGSALWGYTAEYDKVLPIGDEEVTVSLSTYPKTLTVEDQLYLRAGFVVWDFSGDGEGSLVLVEDTSITVPKAPIYQSKEYRDWRNTYANITVAYLPHTHAYAAATCTSPATCDCGETTGAKDASNHAGGTELRGAREASEFEEGYTGDRYCLGCGALIEEGEAIPTTHTHAYAAATCTSPATCDCGETTGAKDASNHAGGTELRGYVAPTEQQTGYSGDTHCLGCGARIQKGTIIYIVHQHQYTPKFDDTHHWEECSCGETQNQAEHAYTGNADTTCDCGYTRTVVTFTVTYTDGVEDAEAFADQTHTVAAGDATPSFDGAPTRQGFCFLGWEPALAETVTANVIYTARWEEELTLTPHHTVSRAGDPITFRTNKPAELTVFCADTSAESVRIEQNNATTWKVSFPDHPGLEFVITAKAGSETVSCTIHTEEGLKQPTVDAALVSVSAGNKSVFVHAAVMDNTATLQELSLSDSELLADGSRVTYDFSAADTPASISEVVLPRALLAQFGQSDTGLEIVFSHGECFAINSLPSAPERDAWKFSFRQAENDGLTALQRSTISGRPVYDINAYVDGEKISDMGGMITLSVPYMLQPGEDPHGLVAWYVDEGGNRERCETYYDSTNKRVSWKTDHLSIYMIGYEEPASAEPDAVKMTWLWVTLGCVGVLAIGGGVAFAVFRKKRRA